MARFACEIPSGVWCPVEAWRDLDFGCDRRPASVVPAARYGDHDTRYRCGVCRRTFLLAQLQADGAAHAWPATPKEHLMVEVAWSVTCRGAAPEEVGRRVGVDGPTARRWVSAVLERFRAERRPLCAAHDDESLARSRDRRYAFAEPETRAAAADASWHWAACAAELLHRLRGSGAITAADERSSWARVTRRGEVGGEAWTIEVELLKDLRDVTQAAERLGLRLAPDEAVRGPDSQR